MLDVNTGQERFIVFSNVFPRFFFKRQLTTNKGISEDKLSVRVEISM